MASPTMPGCSCDVEAGLVSADDTFEKLAEEDRGGKGLLDEASLDLPGDTPPMKGEL